MEQKPDFKKAYILANDMLVAARCISSFPFDAAEFVKEQTDLKFCSYKRALEKFGLDCRNLGSGSAVLSRRNGRNIVFYNQDEYDAREPFNRLHETGHFLMEHKTDIDKDDPLYGIQEVETNFFAAQMLMPRQVLEEIQRRLYRVDADFLAGSFGVSYSAANLKITTLKKRILLTEEEKMFDDIILEKFKPFIDRIAPRKLADSCSCWDDPMQKVRDSWC